MNASIGFEYKFDDTFGLYFEPGVNYYFKTSRERESFRAENPLTLGLRAGLRINL